MAIIISHRHCVHAAFVSSQVCQTFDRMISGRMSFPGAGFSRWYAVKILGPQMVRDQEVWEPLLSIQYSLSILLDIISRTELLEGKQP